MAAPTNPCDVKILLANSEPSTHGTSGNCCPHVRRLLTVPKRTQAGGEALPVRARKMIAPSQAFVALSLATRSWKEAMNERAVYPHHSITKLVGFRIDQCVIRHVVPFAIG